MITITSIQMNLWIASFIWPLTRILGFFAIAPIFGNQSVTGKVKIGLGIAFAILVSPTLPEMPHIEPMSMAGFLIIAQQMLIGLAMGFSMRLIFAAVEFAGEVIGLTMGLGFASFFDPMTQGRSSVINSFLSLLAMMIFLAANFHLQMVAALFESFQYMPIGGSSISGKGYSQIVVWAGHIFASSLQLSLPIIGVLLVTNAALGILTKAAPQLNIFGIGFPITLSAGMIMIGLMLPYMTRPLMTEFQIGISQIGKITSPHEAQTTPIRATLSTHVIE